MALSILNFISFNNTSNILRKFHGITHLITETTSLNRKCGLKRPVTFVALTRSVIFLSHLDLICAPYVLYGVNYIDLVPLALRRHKTEMWFHLWRLCCIEITFSVLSGNFSQCDFKRPVTFVALTRLRAEDAQTPPWQAEDAQSAPVRQSFPFKGNDRAPPVGSRHSCQPTVKRHILPLVWIFFSGKGVVRGRSGPAAGMYLPVALVATRREALAATTRRAAQTARADDRRAAGAGGEGDHVEAALGGVVPGELACKVKCRASMVCCGTRCQGRCACVAAGRHGIALDCCRTRAARAHPSAHVHIHATGHVHRSAQIGRSADLKPAAESRRTPADAGRRSMPDARPNKTFFI